MAAVVVRLPAGPVRPGGRAPRRLRALDASTIPDASLRVKLMLAESSGKLDLSECGLTEVPPQVFELTELEELSLAGNELTSLPPEIGRLTSLQRLQLSGNRLESLPEEMGALQALEGLWLHGNLLTELPATISDLAALVQLSVAGNCLQALPEGIGRLSGLKELTAAGNRLRCLPPSLEGLAALEILGLHGNRLSALPTSIASLTALKELWLQGNPDLSALPSEVAALPSLAQLSAADCALQDVPAALRDAKSLKSLSLYGNCLGDVPPEILGAPALSGVWLEGNALDSSSVGALVASAADSSATLGLDARQVAGVAPELLAAAGSRLRITEISGSGPGYFKLERAPGREPGSPPAPVLVVAFGSAPGTPNWGGLLGRIRSGGGDAGSTDFDVLYVVDPARAWYGGGSDAEFGQYERRLKAVTGKYRSVVMVGDSMGATAALMFAGQATTVHAFCPQVDLAASSIRPGRGPEWGAVLKERVVAGVGACGGRVTVHVGNWKHDLDQANMLPKEDVHVQIYSVNSHRLAVALDRMERLLPTLRGAILNEMGLPGSNVRVANMF